MEADCDDADGGSADAADVEKVCGSDRSMREEEEIRPVR